MQTAEAILLCVLWVDEIEESLAGSNSSGANDGGTSARALGSFFSWMQEKTSPVFVVATANDVTQLPPELLRTGRWDQMFFVGLPVAQVLTEFEPLSKTMAEHIVALRTWAKGRARFAPTPQRNPNCGAWRRERSGKEPVGGFLFFRCQLR